MAPMMGPEDLELYLSDFTMGPYVLKKCNKEVNSHYCHIQTHQYMQTHTHIYIHIYIYMYIYIYMCVCVCDSLGMLDQFSGLTEVVI